VIRYCLITGATGGLGRALAAEFRGQGYHVIIAARHRGKLDELTETLGGTAHATPVVADLRTSGGARALLAGVEAVTRRLHVVVAGAGIALEESIAEPVEPLDAWHDMIALNIFGVAATARITLPMLRTTGGTLFFIGSIAGTAPRAGDLYSVTKHAVAALAESVRLEAETLGVNVCVVHPGLMRTPMLTGARAARASIRPEDVARAIAGSVAAQLPFQLNTLVLRPTIGDIQND
jgi:short-subunit dehydrogenase